MSKSLEQIKAEFDASMARMESALVDPVARLNKILGGVFSPGGYPVNGRSADCKSAGPSASGGSNPSPPTNP